MTYHGTARRQAAVCQCGAVLLEPFCQKTDPRGPMLVEAFRDEGTISGRLIQQRLPPEYRAECVTNEARIGAREPQPSWLPFVRKQLEAIAALPEGWDSYGGASPDPRLVWAAQSLIECLAQAPGLPQPHVNPTPSGGVQFEWEVGDRYFEVEVVAERAATYLYCDDAAGVEETGNIFELESLEPVLDFVRRVRAAQ
jgi:hypothetical protein